MRILHTEWSDGWGGQERRIVSEMRGMQARGHELYLVTREQARIRREAEDVGIRTFTLPLRSAADLVSIARLARLLRRLRIQVVNTHSGVDSWVGSLAARAARSPALVRTRHLDIPLRRGWNNFVHYLPARIITCGEATRRRLVEECGFPREQLASIPTGIDFTRFTPQRERTEVRQTLGRTPGDKIVLMVGVIRGVKRHLLALDVIARLAEEQPNLHLWLAGDGPMHGDVETHAHELGLAERVHFLGYRDDVADLMQAADALLLTSRSEGIPQAVTQALGLGLPVVATEVGGVPELVKHEQTGLLAPAEDVPALTAALRRVLAQPDWAQALAARGRTNVLARYSLDAMIDATESLYAEILADAADVSRGARSTPK